MLKVLIGILVPIISGLFLWLIKRVKVSLSYTIAESGLFPIDGGQGKFYNIKIKNDGNKRINDINGIISFSTGKIKDLQVHKYIKDSKKISESQMTFEVDYLNPKDEIDCVITTDQGT